ncbi:MAG: hypothetical protein D6795_13170, partial [Deltaproteobacteria bacterium]
LETQVAAIHERELERFRRKVPDLSAAQEEAVRTLLHRCANKILHLPKQRVRERVMQGEESYLDFFRDIFRIE